MGKRGPVGKRSDHKHGHRSKAELEVDRLRVEGEVPVPEPNPLWHRVARDWYEAVRQSAQSHYYEATDWQAAYFTAELMTRVLSADEVNASLVAQIRGMMSDLLTTEGARRRVRLEIERKTGSRPVDDVVDLAAYRDRLTV